MCGRYARRSDKQRIAESMQAHKTGVFDDSHYGPSYNVAPMSLQPIVRLDPETGQRELTAMQWGLVPFWSKDGKTSLSTINARAETVVTNPVYREAMKKRRCLVPADLFYEWKNTGYRLKQPYAISLQDGSLFAFAGLWESWRDRDTGQVKETFTILTTDPNEVVDGIHDRMPVILRPEDYARWLAPGDPSHLPVDLLRPFDSDQMKSWPVSTAVGHVRNNYPELCDEVRPLPLQCRLHIEKDIPLEDGSSQ